MGSKTSKRLIDYTGEEVESVPFKNRSIEAKVVSVYDGDTVKIVFMISKRVPMKLSLRLLGLDAPEMNSKNSLEHDAAMIVKNIVSDLVLNQIVSVRFQQWDKYGGRILGTLFLKSGESVNNYLLNQDLAHYYDGKKKPSWTNKELKQIIDKYDV